MYTQKCLHVRSRAASDTLNPTSITVVTVINRCKVNINFCMSLNRRAYCIRIVNNISSNTQNNQNKEQNIILYLNSSKVFFFVVNDQNAFIRLHSAKDRVKCEINVPENNLCEYYVCTYG